VEEPVSLTPILKTIVIFAAISAPGQLVCAQEVAAYLGLGSAHDSSNGTQIDTFSDGKLNKTPSLGGLFGHIGASVFITKHLGVGGEISWRPSQADYAGIQYRPTFYTFDAIYRPPRGSTKKLAPELRAGIGGVRLHFFPVDDPPCGQVPGCPSSNHFQWHFAAAARWYLTDHLFLRPAFDLHYVNNLSEFGSNWVPQYSVGIGYSLGRGE
jgi:hypothetical protein